MNREQKTNSIEVLQHPAEPKMIDLDRAMEVVARICGRTSSMTRYIAEDLAAISQQPGPKAEARDVVDEAMVVAIADHVRKWMGPIGRDLSLGHVATLHGAIVDGIHAAALTEARNVR